MAAYSIDLRERVARAWDGGLHADSIAAKYEVSRAWVYRLLQRRRDTGSLAPRAQTKFRRRTLTSAQEDRLVALITARPDATLAELQQALPTAAALSTIWRAIDRRGLTVKTSLGPSAGPTCGPETPGSTLSRPRLWPSAFW